MKPKLLFISPSSPFPPTDGKRQRTLAFLNAALQVYEVDFLALGSSENEIINFNENYSKSDLHFLSVPLLKDEVWKKKLGLSFKPNESNIRSFSKLLQEKSYKKIFCRYAISARDLPRKSTFYLDVDDDYEELMKSKIYSENSLWKKIRYCQIFILNSIFYKRILRNSQQLIWVKLQNKNGHILPNFPFQILLSGVRNLRPPRFRNLLFVGKLSYEPNAKGIQWFLKEVWGNLQNEISGIELTIISSVNPSFELQTLIDNSQRVNLEINVSNLHKYYEDNSICIVPIFSGGGSNVKLAESLLMGRKVLATDFGSRGFENWISSGEVKLANTPQEWTKGVLDALNEPWQDKNWRNIRSHFNLIYWNQKFLNILNES